MDVSFLGN